MKIKFLFFLMLGCFSTSLFAQKINQKQAYQFTVDLVNVKDDKVEVSLITPKFTQNEVVYRLPKIVPGTYADYDFGRYISAFKAYDEAGKELSTEKIDANSYKIKNAQKLFKIKYLTDDTWESPEIKGTFVFEPAGTEYADKEVFGINTHCILGYFDGLKRIPYEVTFRKPEGFYGATSMIASKSSANEDLFVMPNYMDLVDAPIMYNKPDTTTLKIGGADILVSVYSPNKMATSAEIASNIKDILEAQKEYLGGKLPIKKYAFVIYLASQLHGVSYGALEHSYSSFYYLPESSAQELSQTIRDVCAHEFFHIVTPLNIHSEEIGDFDFNTPKMSKHLWMYEGLTEYAAGHMQMKQRLIGLPMYLQMLQRKVTSSLNTYKDDLPFAYMSQHVLEKEYKDQYQNVYEKGALIGMCLDIKLRKLSGGKYGTQTLMQDLSKVYGKDRSFKDEELFDKIVEVTKQPSIREFFSRYVEGKEPLPLIEIFESVGLRFETSKPSQSVGFGFAFSNLNVNPETNRIFLMNEGGINAFGQKLGLKSKDEFVSINGIELTSVDKFRDNFGQVVQGAKEGAEVTMVVMRKNEEKGTFDEITLTSTNMKVDNERNYKLSLNSDATDEQKKLRTQWLFSVSE
jgi:predicted metalloprotease with PDZ domain